LEGGKVRVYRDGAAAFGHGEAEASSVAIACTEDGIECLLTDKEGNTFDLDSQGASAAGAKAGPAVVQGIAKMFGYTPEQE
jgi:hypothetical protein